MELAVYITILSFFSGLAAKSMFAAMVPRFLSCFALMWGNIVLSSVALSLAGMLGSPLAWLLVTLFVGSGVWLLVRRGTPVELPGNVGAVESKPGLAQRIEAAVYITTLAVLLSLSIIVAARTSVANWDTLTYHLPRAFFYISQGSLAHFDTVNFRQTIFPLNSTLVLIALIVQGAGDSFFIGFNVLCWVVTGVAAYGIARLGGLNRRSALFGAWLGLCGTEVLAQATSTTNDIHLSAMLLCGVYFVLCWVHRRAWFCVLTGAVALGVGCGVKLTAAFFIPWTCLFLLVEWRKCKELLFDPSDRWLGLRQTLCAGVLILFFATPYVFYNYAATGHFMPQNENTSHAMVKDIDIDEPFIKTQAHAFAQTMAAYTAQFLLDPLQRIPYEQGQSAQSMQWTGYLEKLIAPAFAFWNSAYAMNPLQIFRSAVTEDDIWFGWGAWLVAAGMVASLVMPSSWRGFGFWCMVFAVGCVVSVSFLFKWSWYHQRYFVTAYMLACLCTAAVHQRLWSSPDKKILKGILAFFIFLVLVNAGHYMAFHEFKPFSHVLAPYSKAIPFPVPKKMQEYLSAAKTVHFVQFSKHHIDERLYPFMKLRRGQRFFNHTSEYSPILVASPSQSASDLTIITANRFDEGYDLGPAIFNPIPPGFSAFTVVPVAGKKTKGIERLGVVGRESSVTSFLYYAWPPTGIPRTEGKDDEGVMVLLRYGDSPADDGKQKRIHFGVLGLSPEDDVTIKVYELREKKQTLLWTAQEAGWSNAPDVTGYDALFVTAEDTKTGESLGAGSILNKTLAVKPGIVAYSLAANTVDMVNDPDDIQATVKVENLKAVEGPYPQFNKDYCRWMEGNRASLTFQSNKYIFKDKARFTFSAWVPSAGKLRILSQGNEVYARDVVAGEQINSANMVLPMSSEETVVEFLLETITPLTRENSVLFTELLFEFMPAPKQGER